MDLRGGERDLGEQSFVGHAEVGVGIGGGDGALVDPVEVEAGPRDLLRKGCAGSARSWNIALGVVPPEMAMRARFLFATASMAARVKSCAAARAVSAGVGAMR